MSEPALAVDRRHAIEHGPGNGCELSRNLLPQSLQRIDTDSYQGLSQIGKAGLERFYEERLRGTPGARIIEANAYGRPLREIDYRPGRSGLNLHLTLLHIILYTLLQCRILLCLLLNIRL